MTDDPAARAAEGGPTEDRPAGSAIVVGAGIGGLSAALALRRAGLSVKVIEQAGTLQEVGAGLQITPNATRILRGLGLMARLEAVAVAPLRLKVLSGASGRLLKEDDYAAAAARYGAPFLVIHRADLQAVLADAAIEAGAVLTLGVRLQGVETGPDAARAFFSIDGANQTLCADVLVGADGVRSRVRGHLGLKAPPVFARRLAYRATVPVEEAEPVVRLFLGPNAHLVTYPVKAGRMVNLVAIVHEDRRVERWSEPGDSAAVHATFAGWTKEVRDLLGRAASFTCWGLYDIDPLPVWGKGRATLLGDAAHAMLPFLAQGAAQAIEDAASLAAALKSAQTAEMGLRAYENARALRTARIQREARRNGTAYHFSGPLRLARDAMLKLGPASLLDRYAWIYRA